MGIGKEISKVILKLIDGNTYSSYLPKLINRNSTKMNKNNYKVPTDYSYIFVHIPKTGGMTLNSVVDIINSNIQINKIYKGGHNPISLLHSMDEKKYFTVFRNPVDRAYSYYKMSLRGKKQPYNYLAKKSLYHFAAYCPDVQNIFCKYFSGEIDKDINSDIYNIAEKNIKKFFCVINFSDLENEAKEFFNKIGHKNISIPHINSSPKVEMSDDDRKILEFYNAYDLKLYNYLIENNFFK